MPTFFCVFGRTPSLSLREFRSCYPSIAPNMLSEHLISFSSDLFDPILAMNRLGGVVTIAQWRAHMSSLSPQGLAEVIIATNEGHGGGQLAFGLSGFGVSLVEQDLREIKENLKAQGISARFVLNPKGETYSAAVIIGQKLQEFLVIANPEGGWDVATTVAVQDIQNWGKRDYGRPNADARRGMLPPKVARMITNIGLGEHSQGKTLLDPFCGMGTILAEGYMLGATCYGLDISGEVVKKAQENMRFILKEYPSPLFTPKITEADAVHASAQFFPEYFDAIVTEPFMGDPSLGTKKQPNMETVKNIAKGLEKMYIGCLKDWKKTLRSGGIVVIALPVFEINGREIFVKKVIDSCENLGYSILDGGLEYSRPHAVVKRTFFILKKNT